MGRGDRAAGRETVALGSRHGLPCRGRGVPASPQRGGCSARARTSIARRASLVATAVLHALGLLNFATGRLDPSYAAIAPPVATRWTTETRNPSLGPALYRELARRALRAGCWQEPRIPSDSRHLLEFRQVLLRRGKQMFGSPGCMSGSPPAGRRRPKPLSRSGPRERLVLWPLLQTTVYERLVDL